MSFRGLFLVASALVTACTEREVEPPSEEATRAETEDFCDASGVREVVERLGTRLKEVPLLAPDSIVVKAIRGAYAPFVTVDLLQAWIAEPTRAPGRAVSSPWPDRIEIDSVAPEGPGACRVEGEAIYVTSAEATQGDAALRERVAVRVRGNGEWRVSAYEVVVAPSQDGAPGSAEAAGVLRRYYAAIHARDFRRAYELWGDDGAASGQTFEEFAAGFEETARAEIEIGPPGRVEAAAGSRYVEVPVEIRAVTTSGEQERFEGTYTLRRSVVDGATEQQRRWHIYSATLRRVS